MLDHLGFCCCVAGGRTGQPGDRELGKRMDREVRAAKMTPEERSELARRVAKVSYAAPHPWPHSFLLVTLHAVRGLLVQSPSSGLAPKVRPGQALHLNLNTILTFLQPRIPHQEWLGAARSPLCTVSPSCTKGPFV